MEQCCPKLDTIDGEIRVESRTMSLSFGGFAALLVICSSSSKIAMPFPGWNKSGILHMSRFFLHGEKPEY